MRHLTFLLLSSLAFAPAVRANPVERILSDHPRSLSCASADPRWRVQAIPANPHRRTPAQAVMYRREGAGETAAWIANLPHEVLPAEIRLSSAGHLLTLDDWGEPGTTSHVVCILTPDGAMRRSYALEELLTRAEIGAYVDRPLFDTSWREGASDFFSGAGREWTLRLSWGKILRFDLETGEVLKAVEDRYALRQALQAPALYRVESEGGKPVLAPATAVSAFPGAVFSVRTSARAAGGLGRLQVSGGAIELLGSRYDRVRDEREDVFRALRAGTASIVLSDPRTRFRAEIPVDVR